jgi:hypothetical protein
MLRRDKAEGKQGVGATLGRVSGYGGQAGVGATAGFL